MSECTGPDCTHPSHGHNPQMGMEKIATARPIKKRLTRNQRKTKRKKKIPGY